MGRFDIKTRSGLIYNIIQGISLVSPILDLYPSANAAYSLRLLRSGYTGSSIRVRRSSDNTELNIGFFAGELDVTALLSFVGSGNGFVTTWYDQSGNGQNATQTTAANQPSIITAGVLETQLGKPSVKFLKVNGHGLTTTMVINNPFSIISVLSQDLTTLSQTRVLNSSSVLSAPSILAIRRSDNISVYTGATVLANFPSQVSNAPYLISLLRQTSTTNIYQNNSTVANSSTISSGWGGFEMSTPTDGTAQAFLGKISEVIIYPVNQNSVISGIHSNINSYYSIY